MKTVNIIKITDKERNELIEGYQTNPPTGTSYEDFLSSNENQTLSILRQLKNIYKWTDIEKMVDYVSIIKTVEKAKLTFSLSDDDYKLVMDVFKQAVASGEIKGFAMEKLVQIYQEFKNAT